jgi:hypothetical protein
MNLFLIGITPYDGKRLFPECCVKRTLKAMNSV